MVKNLTYKTGQSSKGISSNKINLGTKIAPYIFISPYFLIWIAFTIFPILFTFYISLTDWNGFDKKIFVGLQNYVHLIKDERFYSALGNTLLFMVMIIPVQIFLGMVIAAMLSNKNMIGKDTFRLFNFLPYLTTPVALGLIFGILFDYQFGNINAVLSGLGLIKENINWLGEPWPSRIMISLITIWRYYGYTSILFLAGITNISPELYEAGDIDGANPVQKFFKITVPLLKPVFIFVVLTTMIGCFQIFEEPFMMFTSQGQPLVGGPENASLTGVWLMYDTAFGTVMNFGYGSTIAYGLFVFIGFLTVIANHIMKRGED